MQTDSVKVLVSICQIAHNITIGCTCGEVELPYKRRVRGVGAIRQHIALNHIVVYTLGENLVSKVRITGTVESLGKTQIHHSAAINMDIARPELINSLVGNGIAVIHFLV